MHQQVRVKLTKPSPTDTPGAMRAGHTQSDPSELPADALFTLLETLAAEGYNLQSVGGSGIEGPGEFVFALDEESHDDSEACRQFLLKKGYSDVVVVEPEVCWVKDERGALAECVGRIKGSGRLIQEMFVGAARNGEVPVAYTTIELTKDGAKNKGKNTR